MFKIIISSIFIASISSCSSYLNDTQNMNKAAFEKARSECCKNWEGNICKEELISGCVRTFGGVNPNDASSFPPINVND